MSDTQLTFSWDDVYWITEQHLPSWGDSRITIVFAPEGRDDAPLSDAEVALVHWTVDHEASISEILLAAVLAEYPAMQESYGYEPKELVKYMPNVSSVAELRQLIALQSVNVHQVSKAGCPYVGFELACRWDEEHGLGVLVHGKRVVAVGGADTAILLWMAEEDAEKP